MEIKIILNYDKKKNVYYKFSIKFKVFVIIVVQRFHYQIIIF